MKKNDCLNFTNRNHIDSPFKTKKTRKFSLMLLLLVFGFAILPNNADALAINCGCNKLKKALKADGDYSLNDAAQVAECHGGLTVKVCISI